MKPSFYLVLALLFYSCGNEELSRSNKQKDLKDPAMFLAQSRYQEALEIYNQLLAIDKDNLNLLYQRALCYSKIGKTAEAVADLRLPVSKENAAAIQLHDSINPIKMRQIGTQIRCNDGTISRSKNRRGTCSKHDGVKDWSEPVYEQYREY